MISYCKIFLLTFLGSFIHHQINAKDIVLVDKGVSVYNIIVPVRSTDIEIKAAKELNKYLKKIANIELPILRDNTKEQANEILIGSARGAKFVNYKQLEEDGILIRTDGDKLILSGGKRKGVLYSVYRFLTVYMGCQKYTRDVEQIRTAKSVSIRDKIIHYENPSFKFRTTFSFESQDAAYCDWFGMNYFFEGRGSFAHTFSSLLPADQYFKDHPEYFAFDGNKRVPSQPCLSNPAVLQIVTSNLKKQMTQKPELLNWSVSQNDDFLYCTCNLCLPLQKKGNGYMEILLPFVNKVARKFPDKTISTLAYNQSLQPPRLSKPERNVEIMFCLTGGNRLFPISDNRNKEAISYRKTLAEWNKLTNNFFLWDYTVNFQHVLAPFPNLFTLQPNLRYYKSMNISKLFEQARGPYPAELSELRSFLLSNLMWNVNYNVDSLITSFTDYYYGPAAQNIREYIYLLHSEGQKSKRSLSPFEHVVITQHDYLSPTNLSRYRVILNKALTSVKNNEMYRRRVQKEMLGIDYTEINMSTYMKGKFSYSEKIIVDKTKKFAKAANESGIIFLNESTNSPDQFSKGIERDLSNPKRFLK